MNQLANNSDDHERCCMRCGRMESQLQPFTKEDGDFEGHEKLCKIYRHVNEGLPKDHEYEKIYDLIKQGYTQEELEDYYGKQKMSEVYYYCDEIKGHMEKSWECRDCVTQPGFWVSTHWEKFYGG